MTDLVAAEDGEVAPDLVLGPATRLLWRSPAQVHLELGTDAVVVEGLPVELVRRVAAARGTQPPTSPDVPAPPAQARRALGSLRSAGFLWQRRDSENDVRPPAPALRGELTGLAVRHGSDASRVLGARRRAAVEVHGTSRIAEHLAAVLASAGVGHVRCASTGDARLVHAMPGGLLPADEGSLRSTAADAAIRRASPDVDTSAVDRRPDLVVIADDAPVPAERRDALHADGIPYLCARLGVDHGVVGPLVVPGLTSCLRCADLVRADRDPAWHALAAQLATPTRYGPPTAVAVAATIAGTAALQVLSFLDGDEPATLDGTLELHPPDWRLRRRSWPMHPGCDCAPTSE